MKELTETQVIVLDTLRTVLVRTIFRTGSIDPALQAAYIATLEEQGLTWSDFIEYAAK